MNESLAGIWFIYDGECPICNYAAHAFKIRQRYGELHLLDARTQQAHPLLQSINQRGLDLDEGMVIFHDGRFYHGKTALRFMAQFGEQEGVFNWFNKALFWSDFLATLLYPWMRAVRNALIRVLGKAKIDNLHLRDEPVFKPVFG
ncbi:MAG TPA: DCC1-like thiol-disulfide oxidoreductase family protein, partial [Pseudomonadales bacterium]|nr:DCC1-like thiol-disulfide oxidoreductase family protein [Pseudomonadales bacterium]